MERDTQLDASRRTGHKVDRNEMPNAGITASKEENARLAHAALGGGFARMPRDYRRTVRVQFR